MNLPERVFDYVCVMVCERVARFHFKQAAQHVNFNPRLFWIVSSAFPLHVECFLSIVVGVGDSQTMDEVCHVLISFNVALCAYVPVCLDVQSVCLCLHALPFLSVVC